jgi:SAM-dependent methyltransferase
MSDRRGAKQPERFDPSRASLLDDPERLAYLAPSEVLELLDAPASAKLVDFGAGTGTYAIAIARLRPDLEVIAVDEQPAMLESLRKRLRREAIANVRARGIETLPSLRARIPRVLAINVLHELGDVALSELRSLLTRDGRAIFIDWNADVDRPVGPPRGHVYSVDEARARLERSGFSILRLGLFRYHFAIVAAASS